MSPTGCRRRAREKKIMPRRLRAVSFRQGINAANPFEVEERETNHFHFSPWFFFTFEPRWGLAGVISFALLISTNVHPFLLFRGGGGSVYTRRLRTKRNRPPSLELTNRERKAIPEEESQRPRGIDTGLYIQEPEDNRPFCSYSTAENGWDHRSMAHMMLSSKAPIKGPLCGHWNTRACTQPDVALLSGGLVQFNFILN